MFSRFSQLYVRQATVSYFVLCLSSPLYSPSISLFCLPPPFPLFPLSISPPSLFLYLYPLYFKSPLPLSSLPSPHFFPLSPHPNPLPSLPPSYPPSFPLHLPSPPFVISLSTYPSLLRSCPLLPLRTLSLSTEAFS